MPFMPSYTRLNAHAHIYIYTHAQSSGLRGRVLNYHYTQKRGGGAKMCNLCLEDDDNYEKYADAIILPCNALCRICRTEDWLDGEKICRPYI